MRLIKNIYHVANPKRVPDNWKAQNDLAQNTTLIHTSVTLAGVRTTNLLNFIVRGSSLAFAAVNPFLHSYIQQSVLALSLNVATTICVYSGMVRS